MLNLFKKIFGKTMPRPLWHTKQILAALSSQIVTQGGDGELQRKSAIETDRATGRLPISLEERLMETAGLTRSAKAVLAQLTAVLHNEAQLRAGQRPVEMLASLQAHLEAQKKQLPELNNPQQTTFNSLDQPRNTQRLSFKLHVQLKQTHAALDNTLKQINTLSARWKAWEGLKTQRPKLTLSKLPQKISPNKPAQGIGSRLGNWIVDAITRNAARETYHHPE